MEKELIIPMAKKLQNNFCVKDIEDVVSIIKQLDYELWESKPTHAGYIDNGNPNKCCGYNGYFVAFVDNPDSDYHQIIWFTNGDTQTENLNSNCLIDNDFGLIYDDDVNIMLKGYEL